MQLAPPCAWFLELQRCQTIWVIPVQFVVLTDIAEIAALQCRAQLLLPLLAILMIARWQHLETGRLAVWNFCDISVGVTWVVLLRNHSR